MEDGCREMYELRRERDTQRERERSGEKENKHKETVMAESKMK